MMSGANSDCGGGGGGGISSFCIAFKSLQSTLWLHNVEPWMMDSDDVAYN